VWGLTRFDPVALTNPKITQMTSENVV
jgi:hypothetical protein